MTHIKSNSDFYMFWMWQYYYRNKLLLSTIDHQVGKKHLRDTIPPAFCPAPISMSQIKKHLNVNSDILLEESIKENLVYKYPKSSIFRYECLSFPHETNDNNPKERHICVDFTKSIQLIKQELDIYYHAMFYDGFGRNIIIERAKKGLTERRLEQTYDLRTVKPAQANKSRSIGLWIWDYAYNDEFTRGSITRACEMFRDNYLDTGKLKKLKYSDQESLSRLYTWTDRQIRTLEFSKARQ